MSAGGQDTNARFIRDIYREAQARGEPVISFEFFTPKTPQGEANFYERVVPALCAMRPGYCSVTYGAGGSDRGRTLEMVERLQREFGLTAMAHLTCVGSASGEISRWLDRAAAAGVRNILALRGDPPQGVKRFEPPPDGFRYAYELVRFIRERGGFSIGVAGFPEGHMECREGKETDWRRLKEKIDCGADFVITQLFFDNRDYYKFRDYLAGKLGVAAPLVPGVIPIMSNRQIRRFTSLCGASIPPRLARELDRLGDDDAAVARFGVEYAAEQCADLLRRGAPGIHFYTLNKAKPIREILRRIGLNPEAAPSPDAEPGDKACQ